MTRVFCTLPCPRLHRWRLSPCTARRPGRKRATGRLAFNNACRTCHSMRARATTGWARACTASSAARPARIEGYAFSSAMQQSGIMWDEATLDPFIANPEKVVHGNAMKPFGGIADAEQRDEIIAYLKSISGK